MLKIGITGGIGSGKTTVCRMFEALGIPVYYADDRAKYLMQQEHFLIDEIKRHFGADIYEHGVLDRKRLAALVFHDKEKLQTLNSLVHPAVYRDTERWMEAQQQKKVPYVLKEAALLVEAGIYKSLDKLIVVTAPESVRLERAARRDNVSPEEVAQRMKNQMSEAEKVKLADFVIDNSGDEAELQRQVTKIHQQLLAL